MTSKFICTILSYTVSKFAFFWDTVYSCLFQQSHIIKPWFWSAI